MPDASPTTPRDARLRTPALYESLLLDACHRLAPRRPASWRTELGFALVGAVLLDLHRHGHVALRAERVLVTNAARACDPVCDFVLEQLVLARRARRPHQWMQARGDEVYQHAMARLETSGLLMPSRHRAFGLFPVTRYSLAPGVGGQGCPTVTELLLVALAPLRMPPSARAGTTSPEVEHMARELGFAIVNESLALRLL